jgi:hypothetical protein
MNRRQLHDDTKHDCSRLRGQYSPPTNAADGYHVIYTARGTQGGRADGFFHPTGNGESGAQVSPSLEAIAQLAGEEIVVEWSSGQGPPEAVRDEFERDVRGRVRLLHVWLGRLTALINDVETWGKALDWSTRGSKSPWLIRRSVATRLPASLCRKARTEFYWSQ